MVLEWVVSIERFVGSIRVSVFVVGVEEGSGTVVSGSAAAAAATTATATTAAVSCEAVG